MFQSNKMKLYSIKGAISAYIVLLTIATSYYISKVFEEFLWDNERVAVTAFISIALLSLYLFLIVTKSEFIKLVVSYHFVLIGVVLCVVISFDNLKFMPFMFVPMIMTALFDVKTGVVSSISVACVLVLGVDEYPLYIFNTMIFVVGAISCFAMNTFGNRYKNIFGMAVYIAVELLFLIFSKIYFKESGFEYENMGFFVCMMITAIVTGIVANILKLFIDMFVNKRTPFFVLKKFTAEDAAALKMMKNKSASLYYHSLEVAELSRLAAKRIGANYQLAYAGGLYHDLGKISGNEYIKSGLKLAEKYGLPRDVRSIMVEHNVKSRLPKTKEAAIVMLSDTAVSAIEYVKRTMDKKEISEMVIMENAINKRVSMGALTKSGLTMDEFYKVKETLLGMKEHQ